MLEELSRTVAEESLDELVEKPSPEPRGSWRDSWTEWATFSETIQRGALLPWMPGADNWDALDMETKEVEMDRMLARLPRQQRQALVLNTVYGYTPAEVADFQARAEADVLADVAQAQHALERYFHDEYLPSVQENLEPPARRTSRRGMQ